MRIAYRSTFAQFVENYLLTYYVAGGNSIRRLIGGPALITLGSILLIVGTAPERGGFFKFVLIVLGGAAIMYGAFDLARPLLSIFLVWLRREQFLGKEGDVVALELLDEGLGIEQGEEHFEVSYDQITAVQRREDSSWILTEPDNMLYVPREGLLEGDHDSFFDALEARLAADDEKPKRLPQHPHYPPLE
jgi:hypothetical protein